MYIDRYLTHLTNVPPLTALLLLAAGVASLIWGWRVFKGLVVFDALLVGAYGGYGLGMWLEQPDLAVVLAVVGGVVLAAVVWPLMKFAVSVIGALLGSALGLIVWETIARQAQQPQLADMAWIGALIGLITMGLLAFVIFKSMVMVIMALQGAFFVASGLLAMAMRVEGLRPSVVAELQARPYLLPAVVLVLAALGLICQYTKSTEPPPAKK